MTFLFFSSPLPLLSHFSSLCPCNTELFGGQWKSNCELVRYSLRTLPYVPSIISQHVPSNLPSSEYKKGSSDCFASCLCSSSSDPSLLIYTLTFNLVGLQAIGYRGTNLGQFHQFSELILYTSICLGKAPSEVLGNSQDAY